MDVLGDSDYTNSAEGESDGEHPILNIWCGDMSDDAESAFSGVYIPETREIFRWNAEHPELGLRARSGARGRGREHGVLLQRGATQRRVGHVQGTWCELRSERGHLDTWNDAEARSEERFNHSVRGGFQSPVRKRVARNGGSYTPIRSCPVSEVRGESPQRESQEEDAGLQERRSDRALGCNRNGKNPRSI